MQQTPFGETEPQRNRYAEKPSELLHDLEVANSFSPTLVLAGFSAQEARNTQMLSLSIGMPLRFIQAKKDPWTKERADEFIQKHPTGVIVRPPIPILHDPQSIYRAYRPLHIYDENGHIHHIWATTAALDLVTILLPHNLPTDATDIGQFTHEARFNVTDFLDLASQYLRDYKDYAKQAFQLLIGEIWARANQRDLEMVPTRFLDAFIQLYPDGYARFSTDRYYYFLLHDEKLRRKLARCTSDLDTLSMKYPTYRRKTELEHVITILKGTRELTTDEQAKYQTWLPGRIF